MPPGRRDSTTVVTYLGIGHSGTHVLAGRPAERRLHYDENAVDDNSSLSSRTQVDTGGSRSHAGRIGCLEDAEGPSANADVPTAADNAASACTPSQTLSDASKRMAVYMADAKGIVPRGNQGAGQSHAHPSPRAQPQFQPVSEVAKAQRMAARLQHHLTYGAVGRATGSLERMPPMELNEDRIRELHAAPSRGAPYATS